MKVDFVTNIAPHYRRCLWLTLLGEQDLNAKFFFGENSDSSIRPIDFSSSEWNQYLPNLVRVRNRYFRNVLIWQGRIIKLAFSTRADVCVFLGDMFVCSTWLAVAILKVRRKRAAFWGHGMYGNEKAFRRIVRKTFLRLADLNFVYGERARALLLRSGFAEDTVSVVYNSLDYDSQFALRTAAIDGYFYKGLGVFDAPGCPTLIFVGRLTRQKRLDQLIEAVKFLNLEAIEYNLVLVGDGPDRERLEFLSADLRSSVCFFGPCYDESRLARFISNADLCVAPGEVGLTAIHCLAYGTPVCTHGEMDEQMPEAEAIVQGKSGFFFDGTVAGLCKGIEAWFEKADDRERIRAACYEVVDTTYNPANQSRIFRDSLHRVLGII